VCPWFRTVFEEESTTLLVEDRPLVTVLCSL
jgi:hypothetical protein